MSRLVVWAPEAQLDFKNQIDYIAQDSVQNARLVAGRIKSAIVLLAEHPIGRAGRVPNTYEKVVLNTSFVIAYTIDDKDSLSILRIIHSAQNWPENRFPVL